MKYTTKTKERRKLVDYYNQRWEEKFNEKAYFQYKNRFDSVHLCSKSMWFIRYLVEQKKIDWSKEIFTGPISIISKDWTLVKKEDEIELYTIYLVACLSIQDEQIETLLDVLL